MTAGAGFFSMPLIYPGGSHSALSQNFLLISPKPPVLEPGPVEIQARLFAGGFFMDLPRRVKTSFWGNERIAGFFQRLLPRLSHSHIPAPNISRPDRQRFFRWVRLRRKSWLWGTHPPHPNPPCPRSIHPSGWEGTVGVFPLTLLSLQRLCRNSSWHWKRTFRIPNI